MSETTAGGLIWEALAGDEQARKRQFITQVRRAAELSRENERLTERLAAAEALLRDVCGVIERNGEMSDDGCFVRVSFRKEWYEAAKGWRDEQGTDSDDAQ